MEGGKLKMEGGKVTEMRRGFFFFFSCHFSKPVKFVLGVHVPKWKFSTGKKHFTPGKKNQKNDFASSGKKKSCYAPDGSSIACKAQSLHPSEKGIR